MGTLRGHWIHLYEVWEVFGDTMGVIGGRIINAIGALAKMWRYFCKKKSELYILMKLVPLPKCGNIFCKKRSELYRLMQLVPQPKCGNICSKKSKHIDTLLCSGINIRRRPLRSPQLGLASLGNKLMVGIFQNMLSDWQNCIFSTKIRLCTLSRFRQQYIGLQFGQLQKHDSSNGPFWNS